MKKLINVNHSTHYFGKLIQITTPYINDIELDIYPNKSFNIELVKNDNTNSVTLIGLSMYLWWCK